MAETEAPTLSWSVHEFEKKDRHPDWIWAAGFVALVIAVLSFFYGNIFFGIFALIAGGAVIFFALREPKTITVTLSAETVRVDEQIIPYTKIEKFWLDEHGKTDKLLLAAKTGFVPVITIPLGEVAAETVREYLKQRCTESAIPVSFSTELFDRLGF
ncbi:MAG TPA: hypothetical protein VLB02_02585 [Candidatus Paceibacterota bacterium]|nr:hypothetical protein [Candidatus Paceibacterota bacterium]